MPRSPQGGIIKDERDLHIHELHTSIYRYVLLHACRRGADTNSLCTKCVSGSSSAWYVPADEGLCCREGSLRKGTCPQHMLPRSSIMHIQTCITCTASRNTSLNSNRASCEYSS